FRLLLLFCCRGLRVRSDENAPTPFRCSLEALDCSPFTSCPMKTGLSCRWSWLAFRGQAFCRCLTPFSQDPLRHKKWAFIWEFSTSLLYCLKLSTPLSVVRS